ncbi:MAG TPA: hypothetical protein VE404_04615, partial [Verrucomicrobiae bacterium]|nr:hypothetical protein [Verrucomicrobiae bacterium]
MLPQPVRSIHSVTLVAILLALSGGAADAKPKSTTLPGHSADARFKHSLPRLKFWNQVAIDASGIDH